MKSPASLLDELGVMAPSEINIEAIAQYCGATVVYQRLEGCEARILGYGNKAIITVDERVNRGRQRFSAAHELGHWMCDRGSVEFSCSDAALSSGWDRNGPEQRANRYAADLILPVEMF